MQKCLTTVSPLTTIQLNDEDAENPILVVVKHYPGHQQAWLKPLSLNNGTLSTSRAKKIS